MAQNPPAGIEGLATVAADQISHTHASEILIAPLDGCLLDQAFCANAELLLQTRLQSKIPNIHFIDQSAITTQLTQQGLLPIDRYDEVTLNAVAADSGAHLLVTENLYWNGRNYEMADRVTDLAKKKMVCLLKMEANPSVPSGDDPVVFRDTEDAAALIIFKQKKSGFHIFRMPVCIACDVPPELRPMVPLVQGGAILRVTISEQGTIEQIGQSWCNSGSRNCEEEKKSIKDILATWRVKPAIDSSGKPFAARTDIMVNLSATTRGGASGLPAWESDDPSYENSLRLRP